MLGWQSRAHMVDIHSHIIWGVDDGPGTIEESISMLESAAGAGTADIVATPHANGRVQCPLIISLLNPPGSSEESVRH